MRDGIRIGKLFGVDVVIDHSWTFIFLLMSWNLTSAFRQWHPTWSTGTSAALSFVATLLFFTSVVIHEFGHALVARSFGMVVREIRLFLFGGVSNIEREPPSAKAEFWMAIAGPVISIGIGIDLLFAAGWFFRNIDPARAWDVFVSLGPLPTLLLWLGAVNVTVGTFNLIPGFPLDGGRILRAALWATEGDLHKATRQASTVGLTIGWLFIVVGIAMCFGAQIPFFGRGFVSGLWLAFMGWFLSSASRASYQSLLVEEVVAGVRVASLMRRRGYAIPPTATVGAAVREWFMRSAERTFPIVDDSDRFVGIVSVSNIRKVPAASWERTLVTDVMTPAAQVTVTQPNEEIASALRKLGPLGVAELPVVDEGRLVGMLFQRDVARWLELRLMTSNIATPRTA